MNLQDHWRNSFKSPDRRPTWQWAVENIKELPPAVSRREFDIDGSRHFIGPFDALDDDYVRQVVIRKPVRGGGSLIGDIWQVRNRALDPGPAMDVFQSDPVAEDHGRNRPVWLMRRLSSIAHLLPEDRKITACQITFLDGIPYYITGPGINNLQTKGIRYMRLDEPVLYKPGTIAEAKGRLGDYEKLENSKICLISQAGEEQDDFERCFDEGDQATWTVQCISCSQDFIPRWSHKKDDGESAGMRWDTHKDAQGFWSVEDCLETIRYECPHCGFAHKDNPNTKAEWNRVGKYVSRNPEAGKSKRSFHWNAIIDSPWKPLVEEFLNASNAYKMGAPEPLIAFFTKKMAEPKSLRTLGLGAVEFTRKPLELDPTKEHMRVMTVDRQETHYWVLICSWSKDGECRRLWFGKLYSRAELKAKADEWKCHNVINDAGYEAKGIHGVYATCALYNQPGVQVWLAAKGVPEKSLKRHLDQSTIIESSFSDPIPADAEQGAHGAGQMMCTLYNFSSDRLADQLQLLINRGKFIDPAGVDESDPMEIEWREQMASEYKCKTTNKKTGRPEWTWIRARPNNHAWDCAKLQELSATMAGIVPDVEV